MFHLLLEFLQNIEYKQRYEYLLHRYHTIKIVPYVDVPKIKNLFQIVCGVPKSYGLGIQFQRVYLIVCTLIVLILVHIADAIFWCHLKIREVDKEDDLCTCHKLTETTTTQTGDGINL